MTTQRLYTESYNTAYKKSASNANLRIFTVLWGIATLFHMAHSNLFTTKFSYVLLTLAALCAILKPSFNTLLMLITLQLCDFIFHSPNVTNHWQFTAFVNLTLIQVVIYQIIKQRSLSINETSFFNTFAPIVRWEIIILYFFAVFHKLNSGFFTVETSCATSLLEAQHIEGLIPLTPGLLKFNAYFVIIVESLIPLFLIFRKTRYVGVLVGMLFHCILSYSSYNPFYDFSSMILASYFLFIDPAVATWIIQKKNVLLTNIKNFNTHFSISKFILIQFLFVTGIAVVYIINKKLPGYRDFYLHFFWTIYSLIYFGVLLATMMSKTIIQKDLQERSSPLFTIGSTSFILFPILVFLNGMCPYLGLNTEISFSMFSNLRTEGGITNHYIIPASFQFFDFQKYPVEIISSSDETLQQMAREEKQMVLFELKNFVNERKTAEVVFNYKGKQYQYKRGADTTGILSENPYALYKLMRFRVFNKYEPQPCGH